MNPSQLDRAITLYRQGKLKPALQEVIRLLQSNPRAPQLYNLLGAIHAAQGNPAGAETAYRQAIALAPQFAEAHNNLGVTLADRGKISDALTHYQTALQLQPDYASAHLNRGNALAALRRYPEARDSLGRAVALEPKSHKAHNNLGNVLDAQGLLSAAADCYRRALALKPDWAEAHSNLGNSLLRAGELATARKHLGHAIALSPDNMEARGTLVFAQSYSAGVDPVETLASARELGDALTRAMTPCHRERDTFADQRGKPAARIGFLSADFGRHSVGYFALPVLTALAPLLAERGGELVLYSTRPEYQEDSMTEKFLELPADFRRVAGSSDRILVDQIRSQKLDVLVDLAGYTRGGRPAVTAARAAPLQLSWLGYCGTTGIPAMDYVLADEQVLPEDCDAHFSETIYRLPRCYLSMDPPDSEQVVNSLPALENGGITFGSFNNLAKLSDESVALWSDLLTAVPTSRLLMKTRQLGDPEIAAGTAQRFAAHGIASDRLELRGHLEDRSQHFAAYNEVDIALDTWPYQGVTTTVEALWMGVPVLALAGNRFVARNAATLLHATGLDDWIATDEADFLARCLQYTRDLQQLAHLRASLRARVEGSALFDTADFAREFLAACDEMLQS